MMYTTKVKRKMCTYHLNNQLMLNTLIFFIVYQILAMLNEHLPAGGREEVLQAQQEERGKS